MAMNNCERLERVFRAITKSTMTHSELLSALRRTFPAVKDFLIADHYENYKRDAAGNPIGGAAGHGSSCKYKPKGCMVRVAPRTYRLAPGDRELRAVQGNITTDRSESRISGGPSTTSAPYIALEMSDPLGGFNWDTLYQRYDAACKRFEPRSPHLSGVTPPTGTDRALYCRLVQTAALNGGKRPALDLGWYKALLYWKLYSSTPEPRITSWLQRFAAERLRQALAQMPVTIPQDVDYILELVESIDSYQLPGMASPEALPVRTTFLHILYPHVVPIFDKMVLKAVGAWFEGANKSKAVLRQYLPHAWTLAKRHTEQLAGFQESPVRLVDMALWVQRGTQ